MTERETLPLATTKLIMLQQNKPDLHRFLGRLTKRSILSAEEQQAILALPTYTFQVEANRDFVRLNEVVDHACVVLDGFVGRFGQNSEGARQITAIHIAGDMPDLHSVVQPKSSAALQALSTATIARVPHSASREVAAYYPAVAEALWRDCMVDSGILAQCLVNVGRRDAKTRIAHLLSELAMRDGSGREGEEIAFPLKITQTHLADATGLTPVHVNRTLKSLRDEGVVTVSNQRVHIHRWTELMEAGDFDGAYLQADLPPEDRIRIVQTA